MALVTLDLISDWHRWVHRRVETFALADPVAVQRHVSVDFTLHHDVPPVLGQRDSARVYCAPLGLLRKRKLRNFDLRDESNRVLPLMTAAKNGAVAAGVLAHASDTFADPPGTAEEMPAAVWESLWAIANSPRQEALRHWEGLGRPADRANATESAWREALVLNRQFMALANDLARNFLVLVPLEGHPNQRRVLKLSYEETQPEVDPTLAQLGRLMRGKFADRGKTTAEPKAPEEEFSEEGVGLVKIRATSVRTDSSGEAKRGAGGEDLPPQPQPHLEIVVRGPTSPPYVIRTKPDGCAYLLLAPGTYEFEERVPRGLLEQSDPSQQLEVKAGRTSELAFSHKQVGSLSMQPTLDSAAHREKLTHRMLRFWGWRAERLVFLVPAVGQAASYHVEFEAPEDLAVTRGRLSARASYWDPAEKADLPVAEDLEAFSVPRSHLYLAGVGQDHSARAIFNLRPRPSTIIRAAVLSAAVTTILICVVALRLDAVRGQVGPTVTLLLLIPGALSAYIGRPREHPFTTRTAFGLRMIAISPALWAFLTALTVVLSRSWNPGTSGAYEPGRSWPWTGELCGLFGALSLSSCVALLLLWRLAARPPEQRPRS